MQRRFIVRWRKYSQRKMYAIGEVNGDKGREREEDKGKIGKDVDI